MNRTCLFLFVLLFGWNTCLAQFNLASSFSYEHTSTINHSSEGRKVVTDINKNIYTLIDNQQWAGVPQGAALIHGVSPHTDPVPYPGRDAFGNGANLFSSTDTLLYP